MTRTLADIDALLAAPKAIVGAPAWVEEANRGIWRADLAQGGVVIGGLWLTINVLTHTAEQRGNALLIFDGRPVQRLSFRPDHTHPNPNAHPAPVALRRLILPRGASRIYRWSDNRAWPPPDRLAARAIDPEPETLAQAIAGFLVKCGIAGSVPPAPWRPTLI